MENIQIFKPASKPIWLNDAPYNEQFADVYFSPTDGLAESRHVFLRGNALPERWSRDSSPFVVGELGFGTGLNFLALWQAWIQSNSKSKTGQTLHFYSCDLHPLGRQDFESIQEQISFRWPELEPLSKSLRQQYPFQVPGWTFHSWPEQGLSLSFFQGSANEFLQQIPQPAHAWFLDGFSPAKNPTMWNAGLWQRLAQATAPGGSFATFSSAGQVRRSLAEVGFEVRKTKGFGNKREMAVGVFQKAATARLEPWFDPKRDFSSNKEAVAVIGAGVSGVSAAYSLAQRSVPVTLFESHDRVGQAASGNAAALIMPLLASERAPLSDLHHTALQFSLKRIAQLDMPKMKGVSKFAHSELEWKRMQKYYLVYGGDESFVQICRQKKSLHFPGCGFIDPAVYLQRHLENSQSCLELRLQTGVTHLEYRSSFRAWVLRDSHGREQIFSKVILASGSAYNRFGPETWLPLRLTRGQVDTYQVKRGNSVIPEGAAWSYDGYVIRQSSDRYLLGATFDREYSHLLWSRADSEKMRKLLIQRFPQLAASFSRSLGGRVAERAQSPDHFPLVGEMPDIRDYCQKFQGLAMDARKRNYAVPRAIPGLFISLGMGSRGMSWAPLMGEVLASRVLQQPLPLGVDAWKNLHASRFIIRRLRQALKSR